MTRRICTPSHDEILEEHERRLRSCENEVSGPWIWVGTYPNGNTTPDSPPYQNGWDGSLRLRWVHNKGVELLGRIFGGPSGTVVTTLPSGYWPSTTRTFLAVSKVGGNVVRFQLDTSGNLTCWYSDVTLNDDPYLSVWGYYNGNPAMHSTWVARPSDAWLRFQLRNDEPIASLGTLYDMGLVLSEQVDDPYYSGGSWDTAKSIAISTANGLGLGWRAQPINCSIPSGSGTSSGGNGVGTRPVVDLRAQRTGTVAGTPTIGVWNVEVWVDNVQRYSGSWQTQGDPSHPMGINGLAGVVIYSHYGDYANLAHLNFDNISAGTTRGAHDLLAVQDFSDGTFGALVDDSFDGGGATPATFQVITSGGVYVSATIPFDGFPFTP